LGPIAVSPDELTENALWLANTPSLEFPEMKKNRLEITLIAMPREEVDTELASSTQHPLRHAEKRPCGILFL
jgi:hypothetical protein